MLMIDNDDCVRAYQEITNAVRNYGTAIIMQIAHCGRQTRSKSTGLQTVAPSAIRDSFYNEDKPKELSENEIRQIIDNFVSAIVRVKQAGFDGVQLHLAHGFLLSQFLSSHSNRRKDRWGGSTENKYRIVDEIFKKAKERVGVYPILVKMNAYDGRRNGMRIEESVQIAQIATLRQCLI
jgi:2,4-dienoyl-CoA reductase-like NADH-dependent reductase (Old Yellow Enzyme family)